MDIPSDMEGDMNFDMNVEGGEIVEDGVMLPEGAVPGGMLQLVMVKVQN